MDNNQSRQFVNNENLTKQFVNIVKPVKTNTPGTAKRPVNVISMDNALYGLRKPKIKVRLVSPAPENADRSHVTTEFYLDVNSGEVDEIITVLNRAQVTTKNQEIFKSYQGTPKEDKRTHEKYIEARAMHILATNVEGRGVFYQFVVENGLGVQKSIKNGAGENVPGTVSFKSGTKPTKCSFGASQKEASFIARMLSRELQAWRNAINMNMCYHPEKFRRNANNNYQNTTAPTANQGSKPPTA